VVAVAASPTANLLASSGRNPKIRLWDMDQRKVIATLSGHGSEVAALAFSPDGEWLASASKDETVRVWKVAADRQADVLTNVSCEGGLQMPLLSPDGRLLAANSSSSELALFDPRVPAVGAGLRSEPSSSRLFHPAATFWSQSQRVACSSYGM